MTLAHRVPGKENFITRFFALEAAGGVLIMAAALCAMIAMNSPLQNAYNTFLHFNFSISAGTHVLSKSLQHWINDGLMAIFFLSVGMEIKREVVEGALSSRKKAMLPLLGACGGVITPALIFITLNYAHPDTLKGWAIPTATDIAFSLAILSLLGTRVSSSLKVFLTAVAIADDLIAVLIIACFYTAAIAPSPLMLAGLCVGILTLLNLLNVHRLLPYLLLGSLLWLCVLLSGVHASIAGAVLGLTIPLRTSSFHAGSPLKKLEETLHPWVAYGILPLFAFANAGISLQKIRFEQLGEPVLLGIMLGLFLGKQIGVFSACWLAVKLGWANRPAGTTWLQCYAVCVICGIGFTMSLFIGGLSYQDATLITETKLGVIMGSLLSGVTGYCLFRLSSARKKANHPS